MAGGRGDAGAPDRGRSATTRCSSWARRRGSTTGRWRRQLLEATGIDIGLWQEGIARVAADEAEAAELRSRVAWQRQQGYLSDWLDADEVAARWPWLGPTPGRAVGGRTRARSSPQKLVRALLADAATAGAEVAADRAIAVERGATG